MMLGGALAEQSELALSDGRQKTASLTMYAIQCQNVSDVLTAAIWPVVHWKLLPRVSFCLLVEILAAFFR
jgi:hypothetical protein